MSAARSSPLLPRLSNRSPCWDKRPAARDVPKRPDRGPRPCQERKALPLVQLGSSVVADVNRQPASRLAG
jgi:hypothetical protein